MYYLHYTSYNPLASYSTVQEEWLESVEITNKMQPCNRIYYSEVY